MDIEEEGARIQKWLGVFVAGFSETRSLTHPYKVRELSPSIWLLADAPRRSGAYRKPEVVAWGCEPDPTVRLYAAFDGDTPIGGDRSVKTHPDCAWVAGLFVNPISRGQGIGQSLMAALLEDDARHGILHCVLLASAAGSRLYPYLGYRVEGMLNVYTGVLS